MVLLSTLLMFFNTYFMMIFLKILGNMFGESNFIIEIFLYGAHTFHLFKETMDFLFNPTYMTDSLNQLRNPVTSLILNPHTLLQQMLNLLLAVMQLFPQTMTFLLKVLTLILPVLTLLHTFMVFLLKVVQLILRLMQLPL